ncbi:hypothetical protein [Cytobacillus praedii]|uniref:hypothetical protein n=1 Tax=Cytobacillus praedii TaxID=1742358 RepID=UPI002E1E16BF|nr:hypothetical protein [Cytobacillus praedii]
MATTKLALPTITGTNTANVPRDLNALAQAIDEKAGTPDGFALLGPDGKVLNGDGTQAGEVTSEQFKGLEQKVNTHLVDKANPHGVTKTQVGLGNVDNVKQIPLSEKGQPGGVPMLDENGKIIGADGRPIGSNIREYVVSTSKEVKKGNVVVATIEGKIELPSNSDPIPEFVRSYTGGTFKTYNTGIVGIAKLTEDLTIIGHRISSYENAVTKMNMLAVRFNADDTLTDGNFIDNTDMTNPLLINANNYLSLDRLDDNKFVYGAVLNSSGTTSNFEIGVGVVDPETLTITYIHKQTISLVDTNNNLIHVLNIDTNRFFIAYKVTGQYYGRVVTWNGSTLTLGEAHDIRTGTYHMYKKIDTNKIICTIAGGQAHILNISGYTITKGAATIITGVDSQTIHVINKNRVVTGGTGGNEILLLRINPDDSVTLLDKRTDKPNNTIHQVTSNAFMVAGSATTATVYKYDSETEKLIPYKATFPSVTYILTSSWVARGKFISFRFLGSGNPTTNYDIFYSKGDVGRILGIALEDKTSGQLCKVAVGGSIVEGIFTDIKAGLSYVSIDGILTESWIGTSYKIAKGITANEVLVI